MNHHEGQAHAARAGDSEPRVRVAQASCARHEAGWRMGWRITNLTSSGMRLLDARFPHGQFRSGLIQLADVRVAPSESAEVEAVVVCNGGLGDVVENTFLITTVRMAKGPLADTGPHDRAVRGGRGAHRGYGTRDGSTGGVFRFQVSS